MRAPCAAIGGRRRARAAAARGSARARARAPTASPLYRVWQVSPGREADLRRGQRCAVSVAGPRFVAGATGSDPSRRGRRLHLLQSVVQLAFDQLALVGSILEAALVSQTHVQLALDQLALLQLAL